jgi:hypothetical protein
MAGGLFGNEYFEFANYQIAECITAEGTYSQTNGVDGTERPFQLQGRVRLYGSTFFNGGTDTKVQDFIQRCRDELGVIVELKTVFINSIFYLKKNRYVVISLTSTEKASLCHVDLCC